MESILKKYSDFRLNESFRPHEGDDWILDETEDLWESEELNEKQGKALANMTPEQHMRYRQNEVEAEEWHKAHPISHLNVVDHFNQATKDEMHHGENWYKDAHHITKVLAKDTGVKTHVMAGLVANYSPQTHWATNIMTASMVARHKKALGGPGSGVFADNRQKKAAESMLKGEHYDKVLKGNKVRAFAHLIEHGGDKDPKNPRVVVDRHAYSVAAGGRMSDAAFAKTNLKSQKGYKAVSDAYHAAAQHLSVQHGRAISPHQVQAVTWLVRQRLNAQEEHASAAGVSKTAKVAQTAKNNWDAYASEHHPKVVGKEPGTGYYAKDKS